MRMRAALVALLGCMIFCHPARADLSGIKDRVKNVLGIGKDIPPAHPEGVSLRYHFLRKEDPTQRENYYRLDLAYNTGSRFLNPRGGAEFRVYRSQIRSYWIGDDIDLTKSARVHLRLNHTQFDDWQTAINYTMAYLSYRRWWIRLAVGAGHAAIIFEPDNYQNPLAFDSEINSETRFLYNVSLAPTFYNDRIELDLGLNNFDDYEYHGFDVNGYHIRPTVYIGEDTAISCFYERRYAAAFISVPTLARTTWMVSIQHRF